MGGKHSKGKKSKSAKSSKSALHDSKASGDAPTSSASRLSTNNDYIEAVVCKETDLADNEMKEVKLGEEGKVLLVKQNGKISALGTKCTHYGAPLVNGALGEGRVRCQWHGACFNTNTGDIEDFPGLDSLPCYEVQIEDGNVKVKANKKLLEANKRVKGFSCKKTKESEECIVVAGGGPAGLNCAETLRQEGFDGRLVLVCQENYLPYDRIKVSKSLDTPADKLLLRPQEFYDERNIEVLKGIEVTEVKTEPLAVSLSDGMVINCGKLFLATGSSARTLPIPGFDLENIFLLRTVDDSNRISKLLTPESNVVVMGSSFIGLEASSALVKKVKSVSVIAIEQIPFALILGEKIGRRVQDLFESNGVKFYLECGVKSFEGSGSVNKAILTNGTELPADIVIIGVGTVPNTKFIKEPFNLLKNGTLKVNEYLETEVPGVYAGGDIATAPVLGAEAAIGHWGLANYHGHVAAFNMLGKPKPLRTVPFFWTMLFGKGLRFTGFCPSFDDVVITGSVEDFKFVAYYVKDDVVKAVCTCGMDPVAAKFAEVLHEGKPFERSQIETWLKD